MNKTIIKLIGYGATALGLIATLISDWIGKQEMKEEIREQIRELMPGQEEDAKEDL